MGHGRTVDAVTWTYPTAKSRKSRKQNGRSWRLDGRQTIERGQFDLNFYAGSPVAKPVPSDAGFTGNGGIKRKQ